MSISRKKKNRTPKILKKINSMSDEEFMNYYKKYNAHSIVDMVVGFGLLVGGIALIVYIL